MKRLLFVCALLALIVLPITVVVNTHTGSNGPRAEGLPPPWPTGGIAV